MQRSVSQEGDEPDTEGKQADVLTPDWQSQLKTKPTVHIRVRHK